MEVPPDILPNTASVYPPDDLHSSGAVNDNAAPNPVVRHAELASVTPLAEKLRNRFCNIIAQSGYEPIYGKGGIAPSVSRVAEQHGNMEHASYHYASHNGHLDYQYDVSAMFNGFLLGMAQAVGADERQVQVEGDKIVFRNRVQVEDGKVVFRDEEIEKRINAVLDGTAKASVKVPTEANISAPQPDLFSNMIKSAMAGANLPSPRIHITNSAGYEIKAHRETDEKGATLRYDYIVAGYMLGVHSVAQSVGKAPHPVNLIINNSSVRVHVKDPSDMQAMESLVSGTLRVSSERAGQAL